MNRKPVESSNIAAVGYDADEQVLEVEFRSGGVYQYHGVPENVFQQLLYASSKGRFFHQNIKGRYGWTSIA